MEDTYNKSGFVTAIVALVLNVLFFIYLSFLHPGVVGVDTIGKQSPQPISVQPKEQPK